MKIGPGRQSLSRLKIWRTASRATLIARLEALVIVNVNTASFKQYPTVLAQSPETLSQVGLALLCGPQGRVYSVASIIRDQCENTLEMEYLRANRTKILFALGLQFLKLALQSIAQRAKESLHI